MKKIILVTGASSGIGKACAILLAGPDSCLAVTSFKNTQGLSETADAVRAKGSDCITFSGDISSYEFCSDMISSIIDRYGRIDLLINDAGISYIGLFQCMQPEEWKRIMDVNTGSVFNTCRLTVPHMVSQKSGRIINISSVWGQCGASCEAVYSASKGAINSFTKALAKELAPCQIQVNALACGAIDTPMNAWLSREEEADLCNEIPAGRTGRPEEAAEAVRMIAEAPDYLTGQIITIDGGWI